MVGAQGQAVTEYILLLAVVVGFFALIVRWVNTSGLALKLASVATGSFKASYRYGHPKAKGFDDGGPENHPRAGTNFRIFLNPEPK